MKNLKAVCAAALTLLITCAAHAADRPNVVLIITDDQGYGDLSCTGNPILKTPNIDRLYQESVRLVDYHVAPTCSPTRAALQTGRWTNRTGVWHTIMGRSMLRANEVTIGQVFRDSGYATGMFGKWHLGDNYPYRAHDRGYDIAFYHGGGGVGQTPDHWNNAYFDDTYFLNGEPVATQGFCTDVWFDYATRFILEQKRAGKPFFAYISTNAPHGPMNAPPQCAEPYAALGVGQANFFGMIANIDDNVGKLCALLDAHDLANNTILIFTTDNGTAAGENIHNAAMRGKKDSEYDGGHRVPFFIRWPAGGLTNGRDVIPITAHVDVLPTLADLCNVPLPGHVKLDGLSLRPLLEAAGRATQPSIPWPDRVLFTDSQRVKDPIKWRKSATMTSRWRLINGEELYDIKADPGQHDDIATDHPQVVARLRYAYQQWWAEIEPTFNIDCPIYLGTQHENPSRLTGHDWITAGWAPWNQADIRNAETGDLYTGFWHVNVTQAGRYEIALRRWPREADTPIDAGLPPGDPVPGGWTFRQKPGKAVPVTRAVLKIAGQVHDQPVPPGAKETIFNLDLPAGPTKLDARFFTDDNSWIGAYFAYVRKNSYQ